MTDHRDRVRALIERSTLTGAARELRLTQQTIAKYVAGLPLAEATELLIDARLREHDLANADTQPAR